MEIRHLTGFVAVASHLHFGRAAAQLHIAQPALSQQIATLERELGVKLFRRSTRSVTITQEGERLLPVALRILDDVESAKLVVRAGNGVIGSVVVGFARAHDIVPRLTRLVRAQHPGIRLSLFGHMFAGEVVNQLNSRQIDLGIVRLPIKHPQIEHYVVQHESLVAVLPQDHRLADAEDVAIADLADDPFVTFPASRGSSLREIGVRYAIAAGFNPMVAQEAPDSLTILDLIAAGVGVTLTVSSVAHLHRSGIVVKPVRDELPPVETALVWRRDNESAALRAVLTLARNTIRTPLVVSAEQDTAEAD